MTEPIMMSLLWQHCIQITVVTAIIFGLTTVFLRSRPGVSYLLWMLVLVKCIAPPLGAFDFSLWNLVPMPAPIESNQALHVQSPEPSVLQPSGVLEPLSGSVLASAVSPLEAAKKSWLVPLVSALWLTGTAVFTAGVIRASRRIDLAVRQCSNGSNSRVAQIVSELASKLNLRREPESIVIDFPIGPAVRGVMRPQLLIPQTLLENLSEQQLRLVILHELMHLRRGDIIAGWFQAFVQMVWWFHPGVWLAGYMCSETRERCCDEDVLRFSGIRSSTYAQCLLDAVKLCQIRTRIVGTASFSEVSTLRRRLRHIMQFTSSRPSRWLSATVVIPIGLLVLTGTTSVPQESVASDGADEQTNHGQTDAAVPVPRILAMTWQTADATSTGFSDAPFWTPDGRTMSEAETKAIKAEIRNVKIQPPTQPQSRPLVFVFDVGSQLPAETTGVRVKCLLPDGQITRGGSTYNRAAGRQTPDRIFSISAATHFNRGQDFDWPGSADILLEYPIESPVLIDTLNEIPTEPIEIAEGVRWEIEPEAGYHHWEKFPAGVLETINDGSLDPLVSYTVRVFEKGKDRWLPELYVTNRQREGTLYNIRVSDRFPEPENFDRIEFYRQRFARATTPDVRIRTDLIPQPGD